tara:strand:+ start:2526 stop:2858 length:333 start_codon:yes stop_codon:yes gene_type:complete
LRADMDHGLVERLKKERAELDDRIKEAERINHREMEVKRVLDGIAVATRDGFDVTMRIGMAAGFPTGTVKVENDYIGGKHLVPVIEEVMQLLWDRLNVEHAKIKDEISHM